MTVRYRILGSVEATVGGTPVRLGGPRQRGVLVSLLTRANTLVPASRVVDDLWEDDPPASAANLVQGYVSGLRKALGRETIETRGAGYLLRLDHDALDLHRFERLAEAGSRALADDRPAEAADLLGRALAEWRGPAIGDLDGEPFHRAVASRLDELRLLAEERRLEAGIACGAAEDALVEIRALVDQNPLRERIRWLEMLALWRAGRRADALAAYQDARTALIEEFGLEPGRALRDLEREILTAEEPAPVIWTGQGPGEPRSVMVAALSEDRLEDLVSLATDLARAPRREVLIVMTVSQAPALAAASTRLIAVRDRLLASGIPARAACFTSVTPGVDLARVASEHDVDLLLVDAPEGLIEDARVVTLLTQAPCDVGVVTGGRDRPGPVIVPFAGAEHDWAAIELGAWIALNRGWTLTVAGSAVGPDGQDASRLLANASLAVQRALGVPASPVLVEPRPEALTDAATGAGCVVVGLTDRWRHDGLGRTRSALATGVGAPVILTRRGTRPGGLAPREAQTRFTWTLVS